MTKEIGKFESYSFYQSEWEFKMPHMSIDQKRETFFCDGSKNIFLVFKYAALFINMISVMSEMRNLPYILI